MRNLRFIELVLIVGAVGGLELLALLSGTMSFIMLTLVLVGAGFLYFFLVQRMHDQSVAAVAHANANYSSALDGTAISIAYAKNGSRPALLVSANGKRASYQPHDLRSVGLQEDRKGVYRNVLLLVRDADHPEWLIHFKDTAEAKSWKERILQFHEERGGE